MVVVEEEVKLVVPKDPMAMELAVGMVMVVPLINITFLEGGNTSKQLLVVVVMAMVVVKMAAVGVAAVMVEGTAIHHENSSVVINTLCFPSCMLFYLALKSIKSTKPF
jgi:hypothetical protein